MQVDELIKPFPLKEFHPMPRALLGPGAHEMIGPEALERGVKRPLVMTSGLRGTDIVHKLFESLKYHGLDPVLYYDCPSHFTAPCGFDVLAHASEPYVSRPNFFPSLGRARYSAELVGQHLRAATWHGDNLEAREGMMYRRGP
jgi:alcohol dehydrogenase class IV